MMTLIYKTVFQYYIFIPQYQNSILSELYPDFLVQRKVTDQQSIVENIMKLADLAILLLTLSSLDWLFLLLCKKLLQSPSRFLNRITFKAVSNFIPFF